MVRSVPRGALVLFLETFFVASLHLLCVYAVAFKSFHTSYANLETSKLASTFAVPSMRWMDEDRPCSIDEVAAIISDSVPVVMHSCEEATER